MVQAAGIPELRYDIIDWLRSDAAHLIWRSAVKAGYAIPFMAGRPIPEDDSEIDEAASVCRGVEVLKLEQAELFYVSPDMTDLAVVAGKTLPEFELAPEDLPSRAGLMVFGKPPDPGGHAMGVLAGDLHAVSWGPDPVNPRSAVIGATYYDRSQAAPVIAARTKHRDAWAEPALIYAHGYEFRWPYSGRETQAEWNGPWTTFQATIRSAWLLMQQSLARTTEIAASRASARRLERAGRPPAKVRIIELRRQDPGPAVGMSDREYHHQWIVRGHWRQQPCGPGRVERRPVWIAPHIKGPEGAPMLGGEKVYVLKR